VLAAVMFYYALSKIRPQASEV